MILDTSVLIAILRQEPEAAEFARLIEEHRDVGISVASIVEATVVVGREGRRDLDTLLEALGPEVHAVDRRQLEIARDAWARFGRGSGSQARLNFGDCFAYAAAVARAEPLLFKGKDFPHTDVVDARAR